MPGHVGTHNELMQRICQQSGDAFLMFTLQFEIIGTIVVEF